MFETNDNNQAPSPEQRSQVNNAFGLDEMLTELNEPKQVIESSKPGANAAGNPSPGADPDEPIKNGYDEYLNDTEPVAKLSEEAAQSSGEIMAATVDNLAGSGMAAYAKNNDPEKYQATPKQLDLLSSNWAAVMKKRGSVIETNPEIVLAINNLAIYGGNFRLARMDKEITQVKTEVSNLRDEVEQLKEEKITVKNQPK